MIRLRDKQGKAEELDEDKRFIELCSTDGKVAKLLFIDDSGVIKLIEPYEAEARVYAKLFGVEFCPTINPQARNGIPTRSK